VTRSRGSRVKKCDPLSSLLYPGLIPSSSGDWTGSSDNVRNHKSDTLSCWYSVSSA